MYKQLFEGSKLRLAVAVRVYGKQSGRIRQIGTTLYSSEVEIRALRSVSQLWNFIGKEETHAANSDWLCYALHNGDMYCTSCDNSARCKQSQRM
jgi:hypothetical protein